MGDSGWRAHYNSELRAEEIRAVMTAAQLGERPFVIGHSFGGFMTMKVASQYGDTLGGAVIVDSPIRSPEEEARHPLTRPPMGNQRVYETFDAALARFRLMPEQLCDNPFIVEFIGRHSLRRAENGWVWKFDSDAMGSRRFGEPVREYLQAVGCRAALIFGEKSALVSRETASYMSSLMGPRAPVVEVPEARHHVMLDQPLAFVAALRMLLDNWMRNESVEGKTHAAASGPWDSPPKSGSQQTPRWSARTRTIGPAEGARPRGLGSRSRRISVSRIAFLGGFRMPALSAPG
jgi:pimeloyl-ACP methyl ester carboxylesterase